MYTIYEVPDYIWSNGEIGKIGCTHEPNIRKLAYRNLIFNILEEHTDGWLAGNREIELQKQYNYRVDTIHYMIASNIVNARTSESYIQGKETRMSNPDNSQSYIYKCESAARCNHFRDCQF